MMGVGKSDYEPSFSSIFYLLGSLTKKLSQVPFHMVIICWLVLLLGMRVIHVRGMIIMLSSWSNTSNWSLLVYKHFKSLKLQHNSCWHFNLCNSGIMACNIYIFTVTFYISLQFNHSCDHVLCMIMYFLLDK